MSFIGGVSRMCCCGITYIWYTLLYHIDVKNIIRLVRAGRFFLFISFIIFSMHLEPLLAAVPARNPELYSKEGKGPTTADLVFMGLFSLMVKA